MVETRWSSRYDARTEHPRSVGRSQYHVPADAGGVKSGCISKFSHPGAYLPGVAGAICLLLALTSFQLIPINLAGLLLIVLGMGMLLAELFVTSYGVLGIGGVIAFVIGSLFLIDTSETNLGTSIARSSCRRRRRFQRDLARHRLYRNARPPSTAAPPAARA